MRAVWIVVLVVAGSAVVAGVLFGVRWHDDTYSFDVAKWHARGPGHCDDGFRRDMVDDLQGGDYLRVGMPRDEVIWMLGPSDLINTEEPRDALGWDIGSRPDCKFFWVVFAPTGKRVESWVSE